MAPPFQGDPFPSYRWLRQNRPVHYVELLDVWVVTRYEDVMTVATDPERFSSTDSVPWLNEWLATGSPELAATLAGSVPQGRFFLREDPPAHTWMRGLANKAFSGRRINAFRPRLRQLADELIDAWAAARTMDLVRQFSDPYVSRGMFELLGAPAADHEQLREWAEDMLVMENMMAPEEVRMPAARRWPQCDDYLLDLISERRTQPQDDMLSDLVHGVDAEGRRMSEEDVVFVVRGLCVGGIQSSRVAITNMALSMLTDHSYWEQAAGDPSIIPGLVEESLRRDAPIRGLLRTTTTEVTVSGTHLPEGARLMVLYDAANRDERQFPQPDSFSPGRDNVRTHAAFGQGPHSCIGSHLGRTESRIALEALTQRLPEARIAPGYVPNYLPDFFFRGLGDLPIVW